MTNTDRNAYKAFQRKLASALFDITESNLCKDYAAIKQFVKDIENTCYRMEKYADHMDSVLAKWNSEEFGEDK
jgi:uncharacterized protein Yka (UPF0111/DUF47 family)